MSEERILIECLQYEQRPESSDHLNRPDGRFSIEKVLETRPHSANQRGAVSTLRDSLKDTNLINCL